MGIVHTKHEIHSGKTVYPAGVVQEIPDSDDLIAMGAARKPTETEMQLYRMSNPVKGEDGAEPDTNASKSMTAAEKRAAKAAEKEAAEKEAAEKEAAEKEAAEKEAAEKEAAEKEAAKNADLDL